jgi:rubredoxin
MSCGALLGYKCPRCGCMRHDDGGSKLLCAECGYLYAPEEGGETHGICEACRAKYREELQAEGPVPAQPVPPFPAGLWRDGDVALWELPVSKAQVYLRFRDKGQGKWALVDREGTEVFNQDRPPDFWTRYEHKTETVEMEVRDGV